MGIETPPKCMNLELNSQVGIKGQDSYSSQSDGAPPTSMLRWDAAHNVMYISVMRMTIHAYNSFAKIVGHGTTALQR